MAVADLAFDDMNLPKELGLVELPARVSSASPTKPESRVVAGSTFRGERRYSGVPIPHLGTAPGFDARSIQVTINKCNDFVLLTPPRRALA